MPLISSFYGMYINSQDFSCLLENRPFFTKDVKGFSEATIHFIKNTMLSDNCSVEQTTFYLSRLFI